MAAPIGSRLAALRRCLPAALRPTKNEIGHWRQPALTARQSARLRREAVLRGKVGTYDAATGEGWLLEWDAQRRATVMKVPRIHGHIRAQPARCVRAQAAAAAPARELVSDTRAAGRAAAARRLDKIAAALKEQEKKIADMKKARFSRARAAPHEALVCCAVLPARNSGIREHIFVFVERCV